MISTLQGFDPWRSNDPMGRISETFLGHPLLGNRLQKFSKSAFEANILFLVETFQKGLKTSC